MRNTTPDPLSMLVINAIDRNRVRINKIHIPIECATEQRASHNIAQSRRNNAFPDVQAHGNLGGVEPYPKGDEEHVCDDVVEADGNEGIDRPPDADYFGDELATRGAEDTGEAHEPVGAYGAKKDLVPVGCNLCGWVGLDVGGERGRREG
jgi:hypothetical protein